EFFNAVVGSESCKKLSPIFAKNANVNGTTLHNSKLCFVSNIKRSGYYHSSCHGLDETPITEKNMTFIGTQVRNHEADGPTAHYIGIDDSKPFPLPYLGICMSLGRSCWLMAVEKENGILWCGHKASNEWIQQCKEIVKNMEPLQYNQGEKEKRKRA
ncbi:10594_t:CDS:2, partial [Paraglomus occultum]